MSRVNVKKSLGINIKLIGMFCLLIIVPALITGTSMYLRGVTILSENLQDNSQQLVLQAESSIVNSLKSFEDVASLVAMNENVRNIRTNPTSPEPIIATFNEQFMTDYGNDDYKTSTWRLLDDYANVNADVLWSYMGTENGDMLMRPDGDLNPSYDPRIRPWYIEAIDKKKLIWTAPYNDSTTNELVITAAMPVFKPASTSEVVGVIGFDITLQKMSEKMNEIVIGEEGYVFLIDDFNNIMTSKDANLIGVSLDESLTNANEDLSAEAKTAYGENASQFQKILTGINDSKELVELDNGSFALIHKIDSLNWTMVGIINKDEFRQDATSILFSLALVGSISLIVALFVSILFSRSIINPIDSILKTMTSVKDGDLTVRPQIKSRDELGTLAFYFTDVLEHLNALISNTQILSKQLSEAAHNLAATSEETSASSDEVTKAVEDIAIGAKSQANEAEAGTEIVINLATSFNQLQDLTNGMMTSTQNVVDANENGINAITKLKEKTKQTDIANEQIEQVVQALDNKTQSIRNMLDSISAVAAQTNLLALNASIEAARAGEHGKGFAVVADEIRKLAEQSSMAARDIGAIVGTIISDSTKTVESMNTVRVFAKEQTEAVNNVDYSFATISSSISKIVTEIDAISNSVQSLNSDKELIVNAIHNITQVSEDTAAAAEEVTASMDQQALAVLDVAREAERLNSISLDLNGELTKFKVN